MDSCIPCRELARRGPRECEPCAELPGGGEANAAFCVGTKGRIEPGNEVAKEFERCFEVDAVTVGAMSVVHTVGFSVAMILYWAILKQHKINKITSE